MNTCLRLAIALGSLSLTLACSSSAPAPSPVTTSGSAALSPNAGGCAPSVNVSTSSCSVTVNGTTCDCSDCACISSAVESCVGTLLDDAGLPSLGSGGNIPGLDGGLGLLPDDAGLPFGLGDSGITLPWTDDAGGASASCDSTAIAAAKAQFCSDVDAWLAAHGSTATLDCSQVGATSFPTGVPNLGQGAPALVCSAATQNAFSKAQSTLSTCNPCSYLGWDTSAQLQLFENGVCQP